MGADWMVWSVLALTERKEQPHTTWQGGIWVDEGSLSQGNRAKKLARGTDLCDERTWDTGQRAGKMSAAAAVSRSPRDLHGKAMGKAMGRPARPRQLVNS